MQELCCSKPHKETKRKEMKMKGSSVLGFRAELSIGAKVCIHRWAMLSSNVKAELRPTTAEQPRVQPGF